MRSIPITVVETLGFVRDAAIAMTEGERALLVSFIAANPDQGDIMPGTGGARKLRWKAAGRGKRGGVRVIYYFYNESIPVFLLNVFAKNTKVDLTKDEQNELRSLLPQLVDAYRKGRKK